MYSVEGFEGLKPVGTAGAMPLSLIKTEDGFH